MIKDLRSLDFNASGLRNFSTIAKFEFSIFCIPENGKDCEESCCGWEEEEKDCKDNGA